MPGTLRRLNGNTWEQHWVLGDDLAEDARRLFSVRNDVAAREPDLYWITVHRLAMQMEAVCFRLDDTNRREIASWRPSSTLPSNPDEVIAFLVQEVRALLQGHSPSEVKHKYRRSLVHIHSILPDVFSRIRISPKYGTVEDVGVRVKRDLARLYNLRPNVVDGALFRNLRGFVNDVSTVPGRMFSPEEFQIELLRIWPTMKPVREPPPMDQTDLRRPALSQIFTLQSTCQTVEVTGISGSGKTTLAAEVCERFRTEGAERPVFYIEIDESTELLDVLIGVSFRLRRYGNTEAFRIASRHAAGTTAHEFVLVELARGITDSIVKCLLVIDMTSGNCSDRFARDLRHLLSALAGTECQLAVFGQESALRELTDLERKKLRTRSIDMPGFTFDEFRELVSQNHSDFDYGVLSDVFHSLTAGRSAGLYGRLARVVADASSLDEMIEISRQPPTQLLQRSEREKFARLSNMARAAAEKISCFALAFGRDEAEEVFQDENVGVAIRELLEVGLLRDTGNDSFEMHETVRAGIEGAISRDTKREAHTALANYYRRTGRVSAEVYHLGQAGHESVAMDRAKGAFLKGKNWSQLYNYITARDLVTADEVLDLATSDRKIDGIYFLPDVLSKIGTQQHGERIIKHIRTTSGPFGTDFNWLIAMAEAFLSLAPEREQELYSSSLFAAWPDELRENAVSAITIASRRRGSLDPSDVIALFDGLPKKQKAVFLPVLFEYKTRECLKRAFDLIENHEVDDTRQRHRSQELPFLRVDSHSDVIEFLAALPPVDHAQMLVRRSPLLGRLGPFIWKNRRFFKDHCIAILKEDDADQDVQKNAIRVLALSGNKSFIDLCDGIGARTENPLHGFAATAPCFAPGLVDLKRYEKRVADSDTPFPLKFAAVLILACANADLDVLYNRLKVSEGSSFDARVWDSLLLMVAIGSPFAKAIPILESRLGTHDADQVRIFSVAVKTLGTLSSGEATQMLRTAIRHPNEYVRWSAALALQEKRSKDCLSSLQTQLDTEDQDVIRPELAAAICGSGPSNASELRVPDRQDEDVVIWKCILAGRTRDRTFAGDLVRIANNVSLHWQLRRAAIGAAGYLPYELALEHMIEATHVRSTLSDSHIALHAHSFLSHLLAYDPSYLLQKFICGRNVFVEFVGELFDDGTEDLLDKEDLGCSTAVGDWVYSRLLDAGWPNDLRAVDVVIGELCTPLHFSACLRSLRRVGRTDLIEREITSSRRPWCVMKCVVECMRGGYSGAEDAGRLRRMVEKSGVAFNGRIENLIAEIATGRCKQREAQGEAIGPQSEPPITLNFREAVRLLTTDSKSHSFDEKSTVVLEGTTEDELLRLVVLADPMMDQEGREEVYVPGISFRPYGHTVATRQVTYGGKRETAGAWIRPAIVAGNVYEVGIRWHDEVLRGVGSEIYVRRILDCLVGSGNGGLLYGLLSRDEGHLLQLMGACVAASQIRELIDERVVPILHAYASAGTDEMLESLARIARSVLSADIDQVLVLLWKRWVGEFGVRKEDVASMWNHHYWRAFCELTDHPRFEQIKDWHKDLAPLLYSPGLNWFGKDKIVRVLARDRRSYVHLERVLFRARDWEHGYVDEIDMLDEACERLFAETD